MARTLAFPPSGRYLRHPLRTPLEPVRLAEEQPLIWCKLEFLNPSGSTKDRIARHILEKAWRRGQVRPGSWVVEASSGSTGMALAMACSSLGLRFLAVIPQGASQERLLAIRAYGGEVLVLPEGLGMAAAIARAEQEAERRGGLATRQFENPDNAEAHRLGTAAEVLTQIPGGWVDAVVSGIGTGGTLLGLWGGCRLAGCDCRPYAARPTTGSGGSELECCSFSGRIPGVMDGLSRLHRPEDLPGLEVLEIEDEVALSTTRELIRQGFPVGPSSGLNFAAALEAARRLGPEALVVTVFPDRMERYFSTELFRPYSSADSQAIPKGQRETNQNREQQ